MSKKKQKSSAAENLIESLMDDLKEIQSEASYRMEPPADDFSSLPIQSEALEDTKHGNTVWGNIEKDVDSSEFTGGAHFDGPSSGPESEGSVAPEGIFEVPEGLGNYSEQQDIYSAPSAEEERYNGPSAGYDIMSEQGYSPVSTPVSSEPEVPSMDEATRPVMAAPPSAPQGEDKTVSIQQDIASVASSSSASISSSTSSADVEKTVAVDGFANARLGARKKSDVDVKVSVGNFRGGGRGSGNALTSIDASLAQAENLKLAQQRILDLEKEVEVLRAENEELASAGEIIRTRTDELGIRIASLEKEKEEMRESSQSELLILKGNLQYKENEVAKARVKVEELEARLKSDFKKIRVRERELENRLELLRAEKAALVRSKDEYILEQKRKVDQLTHELDNYRKKCLELNKAIEANQEQVKRTERALRLALTNLETKDENLVPLKKAE